MSPAARRLVGSHFGSLRDKTLAASYTPKPSTPKVLTPASLAATPYGNSGSSFIPTPTPPRSTRTPTLGPSSSSNNSSNHKRRAADFF